MEMFQNIDQENENLEEKSFHSRYHETMLCKQQDLKDLVTAQFEEWHNMLRQIESETHKKIIESFDPYQKVFNEQID